MFGAHQGHKVLPLEEGAKLLRNKIDQAGKGGRSFFSIFELLRVT